MRKSTLPLLVMIVALAAALTAEAQDIREAARRAAADRQMTAERAREIEETILNDRAALVAEVERLEAEQAALENEIADLAEQQRRDEILRGELGDEWSQRELEFREISGNVRVVARDLETLLRQSPLSAGRPDRLAAIEPVLQAGYFPDLDDISALADVFFDEIRRAGQVSRRELEFVGRDGLRVVGEVFNLGTFTTFYRDESEVGFLEYAPGGEQLTALASRPPASLRRQLDKYAAGQADSAPLDLSGGSALRQLGSRAGLMEQLRAGGPIVWPILVIALAALVIVIYKLIFLQRVHGNTDRIMGEVNDLAAAGDWDACGEIVSRHRGKKWPVIHVIRAGLANRSADRDALESVLQESILHELPRLERFLSMLSIFGAVAPLLGLLGTVTGMIDTFRVITLFGTSDPRLMSGGISEALVTTELGLAVAIPIMLLHTFLSRRVDHIVGEMEEKAVQLSNIVRKERQP